MARRIVRTIVQFIAFSLLLSLLLFFLDTRYSLLPQRIHALLPEHHAGIVVLDIEYQSCTRISSCQRDGWTATKDVHLGKSWVKHGYVMLKMKKEAEFKAADGDKVVVDIKVGRIRPQPADGAGEKNTEWESRGAGIWIKRQTKMVDAAVTAVDVLFGPDAVEVREGWQLKEGQLSVGEVPRLTIRRGQPAAPKKPVVRMRKDHKLKIIQVSDLHLSTGVGVCRDPVPASSAAGCEADPRTLQFVEKILDDERPDLAVLTGDQVNGETAHDVQTAVFKFAEPFIKRKIPYATILGNHDDEGNLIRQQIMTLTASLPYSLSEVGPEMGEIVSDRRGRPVREGGAGNYYVEILAHGSGNSAVTLWLLDSHSYSPDPKVDGYDWIKPYQIDWFKRKHAELEPEHKKYAYTHTDLAFIHIPLPEYRTRGAPIVGEWREGVTAPQRNSGFAKALLERGVKVMSVGHDHANDYCMLHKEPTGVGKGLWMCYAGGSGLGGYGGYKSYERRVRIWEVNAPANRVTTWKRVEGGEGGKVDTQTVVEAGQIVEPSGKKEGAKR